MKTCINRYKKYLLAVLLAGGAGLFLAGTNDPLPASKIEGAWVANTAENGARGLVTFAANPSGKSGTYRCQYIFPPEVLEIWSTQIPGFSGFTEEIGEQIMTGKNTGTFTGRFYLLINGRPSLVFVQNSSVTYSRPGEGDIVSELTGYIADANGDPSQEVFPTATYHAVTHRITR
ncbi:MAG TPA: hypothetical protein VJA21_15760 [Verrucomicrobiae bacterium]